MNKATLPLGTLEPLGLEESGGVGTLSIRKDLRHRASPASAQDLVGHDGLEVLEIDELRRSEFGKHCRSLPTSKRNQVLRTYFGWTPLAARATPRCRNPDQVTRFEPVDRPAVDRSTWAPSLEGVGS